MKIYGQLPSPFVRKAHIVAIEKGVAFESIAANSKSTDPAFLAASPLKKVPALEDEGYTLADSSAIFVYLEAVRPEPALLPSDAKARGTAIWFEEFADAALAPPIAKIVRNRFIAPRFHGTTGDEAEAQLGEQELAPLLKYLEENTPEGGWLSGSEYSIADISVTSVLHLLTYTGWQPNGFPRLAALMDRVITRPAWQEVLRLEKEVVASRLLPG